MDIGNESRTEVKMKELKKESIDVCKKSEQACVVSISIRA